MSVPTHITVLGAGSWGTTTASLWARHHPTVVWAREPGQAEEINIAHTNRAFLGDRRPFPALRATGSLSEAVESADVLVFAIPSQWFRSVAEDVEAVPRPWVPVVSLTKGLQRGTAYRMTEVVAEVLPGHPAGLLAGPNLAREVIDGLAAAAVLAMPDEPVAIALQDVFRTTAFRVYTSTDVTGVEIGGALKNVYAIAAGMAAGFETGETAWPASATCSPPATARCPAIGTSVSSWPGADRWERSPAP